MSGNKRIPAEKLAHTSFEAPTDDVSLPANVSPNCLEASDQEIEHRLGCGSYVRRGIVVVGPDEEVTEKPFSSGSIGAMVAVFTLVTLLNIALLFHTPQGFPERTWWSIRQLGLGGLGFAVAPAAQVEDDFPADLVQAQERKFKEALVIGYSVDRENVVDGVVVAGVVDRKLQSLGIVRQIPKDARRRLTEILPETVSRGPALAAVMPGPVDGAIDRGQRSRVSDASAPNAEGQPVATPAGDAEPNLSVGIRWVHPRWLCKISYVNSGEGIPTDLKLHWIVRKLRG
jgi:hypothetical protein